MQGTATGTVTDLNGRFSIDSPKGAVLSLSFIGYKTITVKADGTPLNIVMKEDSEQLDRSSRCHFHRNTEKSKCNRCGRYGRCESVGCTSQSQCGAGTYRVQCRA